MSHRMVPWRPQVSCNLPGNAFSRRTTLAAFRAGADDVELLLKEFAGKFRPDVLMGLDVGECIVKSGGEPARIVRVKAAAP